MGSHSTSFEARPDLPLKRGGLSDPRLIEREVIPDLASHAFTIRKACACQACPLVLLPMAAAVAAAATTVIARETSRSDPVQNEQSKRCKRCQAMRIPCQILAIVLPPFLTSLPRSIATICRSCYRSCRFRFEMRGVFPSSQVETASESSTPRGGDDYNDISRQARPLQFLLIVLSFFALLCTEGLDVASSFYIFWCDSFGDLKSFGAIWQPG